MDNRRILILTSVTIFLVLIATFMLNINVATDYAKELNIEEYNIAFEPNLESGEAIIEDELYLSGDAILEEDEPDLGEAIIEENEADDKKATNTTNTSNTNQTKSTTTSNNTTTKKVVSTMPYYIKVNRTQNVVNIYTKDEEGNYTVPFKAMICSIGTSTPKAGSKYKITTYRREWNALKGNVYGQYAVQIVGNILFHSVPYTAKNKSSLEYWEYDKLGTKASLGCIRLTVQDAKWIYDNIGAGTYVEFYKDDNPGPLGKPSAKKISDNELCRNWDPTDYTEGNPWHNNGNVTTNTTETENTSEVINNTDQTSTMSNDIEKEIEQINDLANNQVVVSGEVYYMDPDDALMLQELISFLSGD